MYIWSLCLPLVRHLWVAPQYSGVNRLSTPFDYLKPGLGGTDWKTYRTQISLLSSVPTIICSSNSTSATFLLRLILFHLSHLHSWQYIARMVRGRLVRPGYVHSPGISLCSVASLWIVDRPWKGQALDTCSYCSFTGSSGSRRYANSGVLVARIGG